VDGSLVKQWALELAEEDCIEKLVASCGWLDNLLHWNKLWFRRVTTLISLN